MSPGGVSVDPSPPSQLDVDMAAIYEGGDNFLARAKFLSEQRAQYQVALANLRVGENARATLDEAKRQSDAAAADRQEAGAALEQARIDAAGIVQRANEQAGAIIGSAQATAGASITEASQVKADADTYARNKKADADAALKRASDSEAAAARARQATEGALKAHQDAQKAYEDAKANVHDRYEKLSEHMTSIQNFYEKEHINLIGILDGI